MPKNTTRNWTVRFHYNDTVPTETIFIGEIMRDTTFSFKREGAY